MPIDPKRTVEFYKQVLLFNKLAGNDKREHDVALAHQIELCEEEWKETLEAFEKRDAVEFLDGIVDSLVVKGYLQAMCDGQFSVLDIFAVSDHCLSWGEYLKHSEKFDVGILEHFCNTLKDKYQVDIEGAMEEVMRSNMSKFLKACPVKVSDAARVYIQSCLDKISKGIEDKNEGRYTGVYAELVETEDSAYYVFKDDKGKVMKGSLFSKPDLKPFVGNLDQFFIDELGEDKTWEEALGKMESDIKKLHKELWGDNLQVFCPSILNISGIRPSDVNSLGQIELNVDFTGDLTKEPTEQTYQLTFTKRQLEVLHSLTGMTYTPDNSAQKMFSEFDELLYGKSGEQDWVDRFTVWDVEADREIPWLIELRENVQDYS